MATEECSDRGLDRRCLRRFQAFYEKKHRPTLGPLRHNVFTAVIDHLPPKGKQTVRTMRPLGRDLILKDWFDQTPTWKAPEIHLDDDRILVLEYT